MLCVLGLFLLFVQGNNVQRTYLNNNFPLTNSLNVYNYLTLKKMNISTICQALIVSMLSVSYPILSQVVARLDDRYSSLIIVDLFNKEKSRKRFLFLLKVSLVFLLIRALELPRIVDIPITLLNILLLSFLLSVLYY